MDQVDARILRALQRDSSRPVAELAGEVGLSPSACHRRVKLLEEAGVITGYAARLDRAALASRSRSSSRSRSTRRAGRR